MPLIKNNEFAENPWQPLDDSQELPTSGSVIISFDRFKSDQEKIASLNLEVGVILSNDLDVFELTSYLDKVKLVVVEFPKFADGRAYSQARTLREHMGYEGEIRAVGDVLPDQAVLMMRCGIDSFEVSEQISLETWRKCTEILNTNYQRSYAVGGDEVRVE